MTAAVNEATGEVVQYDGFLDELGNARNLLERARNISDVLAVLSLADAAKAYARARGLGREAQNYAAEIVLRSQRRLGEMLRDDPEVGSGKPSTLEGLGLTEKRSHRAQRLAAIPAATFDAHIVNVLAAGEDAPPLAAAGLVRIANGMTVVGSETNEWYTPAVYLDAARAVLGGFDLDPASCADGNQSVQAARYYSIDDDGLTQPWKGRVWLNPPYGRLAGDFITRLVRDYKAGDITGAVCLVNAHCTDTRWFQELWDYPLCFTDHRINFAAGTAARSGSTHGSVFAYLGTDPAAFAEQFAQFGAVVRRWPSCR